MHQSIRIGDIVRIVRSGDTGPGSNYFSESIGQIGVVIALAKRLYRPAFKVMVMNEIAEFDIDEVEVVSESR